MSRLFGRARNLAIAFGLLLFAGLAYGVWFYTHRWSDLSDPDVGKCIYGDPACSLTIATWVLCIVTSAAFLAAFAAAGWAKLAFQHEINPRLGQDLCPDEHTPDRKYYLSADANVTEYPPFDESDPESDYDRIDYGFTNLGRSALVTYAFTRNSSP